VESIKNSGYQKGITAFTISFGIITLTLISNIKNGLRAKAHFPLQHENAVIVLKG
jgi:uncharacterized RmlC-like cupin family protein